MDNIQLATLAYAAALIILFLCILFLRIALTRAGYVKYAGYLIRLIGVLPGFLGVIYGIYIHFVLKNPSGLAVMSAALLLEIGCVQLLHILKRYEQGLPADSGPVNQ